MATILKPLSNDFYCEGKGVAYFFPNDPQNEGQHLAGIRLGDMDDLSIAAEREEGETRYSNEHSTKTAALTTTASVTAKVTMTFAQSTMLAITAALMGKRAAFSQAAQTGVELELAAGETKQLDGYDCTITSAKLAGTEDDAVLNRDYMFDAPSGLFEAINAVEITYSVPEISEEMRVGIASGDMPRGKLVYRGVNAQGKRQLVTVFNIELAPSGALALISDGIRTISVEGTAFPIPGKEPGFDIGELRELA